MSAEAQGKAPAAGPPLLATTDVADLVEAVQMLQVRCAQLLICTCFPGPACDTAFDSTFHSVALAFQDLLDELPHYNCRSRGECPQPWPVPVRLLHCPNLPHLHLLRLRYCPSQPRACT